MSAQYSLLRVSGATSRPARVRRGARRLGLLALGALACGSHALALAPAVEGPNATLGAAGGSVGGGTPAAFFLESAAAPLGPWAGLQLDAGLGAARGRGAEGIDGQLFWRDPLRGAAGVFLAGDNGPGGHAGRAALGAESYLGAFTVSLVAGRRSASGVGAFGRLELAWYLAPNLVARLGGEASARAGLGLAGVEYMPVAHALPGLSLFAQGELGGGSGEVLAGLRVYLSRGKSLIRREREDLLTPRVPGFAPPRHVAGAVSP